jgi:hypothetical protein
MQTRRHADALRVCGVTSQMRARSEDDADDELLSVAVVKHGKKVLAGSQSGVVGIFSWGHFDDFSDRVVGEGAVLPVL